ncbi:FAD-dependent monooxygenase [Nonomuraea sp. NPDC050328]|uniref:FAD-dependent monooxygenase n=1 Tax=Nonomuraea sp. NPDC050328 TaxID=3364361 RepID=UPI00379F3262
MDVLISGAGIAGPALAFWLARAGHRVTVVERAPRLRQGGQAVDFRGRVQLGVLERMGLLAAVRERATHVGDTVVEDAAGRRLARLPAVFTSGDVEIVRGDLVGLLHEVTQADVEYVFGDGVAGLRGGEVVFERSGARRFDLVVGADGLGSVVRRLAFGVRRARHLGMYQAVFSMPEGAAEPGSAVMFSLPGVSASVHGHRGRVLGGLDFASPELEPELGADGLDPHRLLAERFAGVGWRVPELLAAARRAPDFYFAPAAQLELERWSAGPVVLLGDAAWAPGPGGMGTGLGLVGAYVLAGELAGSDGAGSDGAGSDGAGSDVAAAVAGAGRRFEAVMRPFVAEGQRQALGAEGFLVPGTRGRIWARNQFFRMASVMPGKGLVGRLASRAADRVPLPDYPLRVAG